MFSEKLTTAFDYTRKIMKETHITSDEHVPVLLHGQTCANFNLKTPPDNSPDDIDTAFNIQGEQRIGKYLVDTLNCLHKAAYTIIMDAIYNPDHSSTNCFFLDGPGVIGKPHLCKTLLSEIRGRGDTVLPAASTGVAANLGRPKVSFPNQTFDSIIINVDVQHKDEFCRCRIY